MARGRGWYNLRKMASRARVLSALLSLLLCAQFVASRSARDAGVRDFADGTNIQLWQCDGSQGQKWTFVPADSTIRLVSDQKCVDISSYGTTDGSNIWLFACHTSDKDPTHQNQEWSFNSNGTITSFLSGKCIDAQDFGKVDGTNVQLWSCSGGDNQKWTFNSSDGTIKGQQSSLCLDVGDRANCSMKPWSSYPYCNYNLDPETRAKDLVPRMTLTEKVIQMVSDQNGVPRLAVPPFGHTECTHGTLNDGKLLTTLFPQALTVAGSFDRDLIHMIARAISDEVRAKHNVANKMGKYNYPNGLVCWAPVLNVCRDPRWGRCQEGYGEDPYLQAEMGWQYVHGLQYGPDANYLEAIATCKHFDVHTGPENIPVSRSSFDSVVSYRDWIETFQPAFQACGEAGARSYMCSYNAINGVPSCANRELLQGLLREEWKFDGFVVSDCGAVSNVYHQHHFARSDFEASEFCVKAGTDWNCGSEYGNLVDVVDQGYLNEELIDLSVTRLMTSFISLGVLDPPERSSYNSLDLSVVDKHVGLALRAAEESIVLMKNKGGVLPLQLSSYSSVAIIGPCADNEVCARGDYDPQPKYIVTTRTAFTNRTSLKVTFAEGCSDVKCTDNSKFAEAIAAAKSSDFVIFVGGTSKEIEGEGNDRSNISLPGLQGELIKMLLGNTKLLVVVLMHGTPVPSPVYEQVDGIISAGYTGQEAGNAIFNVLTGAYNPAGRMPVTWYTNNSQLPDFTSYSMVNRTYRYMRASPQYYFGYGLSFSSFHYSNITVTPASIKPCMNVTVSFSVANTGGMIVGDEVTQLYMTFRDSTVTTPLIKLVGFERIHGIDTDVIILVKMIIQPKQMTVVTDLDFVKVVEPGRYDVFAGGSQPDDPNAPAAILRGSFVIEGSTVPLSQC